MSRAEPVDWWVIAAAVYVAVLGGAFFGAYARSLYRTRRTRKQECDLEELIVEEFRRDTLAKL